MTDQQIQKLSWEGTVVAILLTRGGWLAHEGTFRITRASIQGLWRIASYSQEGVHLRDIFVEPETIAGISIQRGQDDEQEHEEPSA